MMERHRRQAELNHDQTLERLEERGGLSAFEALCAVEGRKLNDKELRQLPGDEVVKRLRGHVTVDMGAELYDLREKVRVARETLVMIHHRADDGQLGEMFDLIRFGLSVLDDPKVHTVHRCPTCSAPIGQLACDGCAAQLCSSCVAGHECPRAREDAREEEWVTDEELAELVKTTAWPRWRDAMRAAFERGLSAGGDYQEVEIRAFPWIDNTPTTSSRCRHGVLQGYLCPRCVDDGDRDQ